MIVSKGFVPIEEDSIHEEEEDEIRPIVVGDDYGFTRKTDKEQKQILNDEARPGEGRARDSSSSSSEESRGKRRRRHDSDDSSDGEPVQLKSALQDEDGDIDLSDLEKAAPVITEKAGLQSASELKEFNR